MKATILQHVGFEEPGYILQWLHKHHFETDVGLVYDPTCNLPEFSQSDVLIVLGGPMGACDEDRYPWLKNEKIFIKNTIKKNIPTLGICLGAQLIADIHGAKISHAPYKEIGWTPMHAASYTNDNLFKFPENFTGFSWHEDQFDIPQNATLLASSVACPNQSFQLGEHVIGVQFHPEILPHMVSNMIKYAGTDITEDPYVQSPKQLLAAPTEYFVENRKITDSLMKYLLRNHQLST